MSHAKISIILPVYNTGTVLTECLDSILSQTLSELEIICINDGSTDSSLTILQSYAVRDSRIIILNQTNQGVAAARNRGMKTAGGEFVAFMDPDDKYLSCDTLEVLYHAAQTNKVQICGGSICYINEKGEEAPTLFSKYLKGNQFTEDKLIDYADYQFDFSFTRFIYQRALLEEHRISFPAYCCFEDPPFLVHAMQAAERFYSISKITYGYRYLENKSNWTSKKSQ